VDSPRPGVVEQDANVLLEKTLDVCRATLASRRNDLRVVALAVATQRATGVLWDTVPARAGARHGLAGHALRGDLDQMASTWDPRCAPPWVVRPACARPTCGPRGTCARPAVADAWRDRRLAFGTVDSWLLWHLSTERACVTTPTNHIVQRLCAGRTPLPDGMDRGARLSAGVAARVAPGCRRLRSHARDLLGIDVPILACAGDQLAGAVGLGCLDAGQSMCLHGTGSFVDLVIGPDLPARSGSRTAR
jgi:glycerol kinase